MDKILFQKEDGSFQWRVGLSEYKNIDYLYFRKWYESYDEGFLPSDEGFNIPLDTEEVKTLIEVLSQFLSKTELDLILNEQKNKGIP